MKYARILKASKSPAIDAVIENLPVNANGYFLDETQMSAIEENLTQAESDAAALITANENAAALQSQLTALATERDTAVASLATANTALTGMTADRDTWKTKAEEYGAKADAPEDTSRKADPPTGGVKKMNSMDAYAAKNGIMRVKA